MPRILIVCEGKVTEPEYIEEFRRHCRNPRVEVIVEGAAGAPMTIVETAKTRKAEAERKARSADDETLLYEQVWCVFDQDEHPRVAEARQFARDNQLLLAMSNPCFELWLLLHVRDSPGPRHRHDVQDLLRRLMPEKLGKHIDFDSLIVGYMDAVARAQRIHREALDAGEEARNPTTEVYLLTESIKQSSGSAGNPLSKSVEHRAKADRAAAAALAQAAAENAAFESEDGCWTDHDD